MAAMAHLIERAELRESASLAVQALIDDAGTTKERAEAIVEAVARAAVKDALATTAGTEPVYGSIVDVRLARLRRIIEELGDGLSPLTAYEAGAVFRITASQGRTLLRTYQARYARDYRARMAAAVTAVAKGAKAKGLKPSRYEFEFADGGTLEYAADRLRRHGFERSLTIDRPALILRVDTGVKVSGQDAKAFLTSDAS
jgi:hypothetical protein